MSLANRLVVVPLVVVIIAAATSSKSLRLRRYKSDRLKFGMIVLQSIAV